MFFIKLIAIIFLVGVIATLVTGVKLLWRLRSFMDGLKGPAAGASRQRGSANPARQESIGWSSGTFGRWFDAFGCPS